MRERERERERMREWQPRETDFSGFEGKIKRGVTDRLSGEA